MKDYKSCKTLAKFKEKYKNQNCRCMYETPTVEEMEKAEAGMICAKCDFKKFVDMAAEVERRSNRN